jgi:hypothetical protein
MQERFCRRCGRQQYVSGQPHISEGSMMSRHAWGKASAMSLLSPAGVQEVWKAAVKKGAGTD